MNNLKLTLYHPTLDLLSDRTLRELLKKLSSLIHKIQTQEVHQLVGNSFLEPREKQSILDRIKPKLNHVPAYYIEKIEKGSLTIAIATTAFAIWLLQITVGKSLEEAWQKSRFHKELVEYLSSDRRKEKIDRNIDIIIDNWSMDRFLIDRIQKDIDKDGDINVKILLISPEGLEEHIEEKEVDIDFVLENAAKLILDLDKQLDKDA